MERNYSEENKFLLITANIGSLFEENGRQLQDNWMSSFHQLVELHKPLFIGLHLQEIGGKTDYQLKQQITSYFEELHDGEVFTDYTSIWSYVDEEYHDHTKYTALGCSYFIHKSLKAVEQWNFNTHSFSSVERKYHLEGITEDTGTIRKFKFPLNCFSKTVKRWPRKGFTWTRWRIDNKVYDLLNIHLVHDACNLTCMKKSPTKYSKHRRRAIEYVLEKLREKESDHQILFGDFNIRPDTKALVGHLMEKISTQEFVNDSNGDPCSITYKSLSNAKLDLLKIGTRFFEFSNYEAFSKDNVPDLIHFDKEVHWLKDEHHYREMEICFQPTYPHSEDPEDKETFGNVRCPSWCDRVLFNSSLFREVIKHDPTALYDSYGHGMCLGDHKPVYLLFNYSGVPADQ